MDCCGLLGGTHAIDDEGRFAVRDHHQSLLGAQIADKCGECLSNASLIGSSTVCRGLMPRSITSERRMLRKNDALLDFR
jgi:hypothetical protein